MVIFICLLSVILISFFIIFEILKIHEMEHENQLMKSYMISMENFYTDIQLKMEIIRKYRHDLKKHIQTLEMLAENQMMISNEFEKYKSTLKSQYKNLEKEECNGFIRFLLSIKEKECERKKIPVKITMDDSSYDKFEELDAVSLLHNLFDNAIEANEKIEKAEDREIRFSMKKTGHEVIIKMTNKIVKGESVTFFTKKPSSFEHGIGMEIIKNIVEKYNGSRNYKVNEIENIFQDEIILYLI